MKLLKFTGCFFKKPNQNLPPDAGGVNVVPLFFQGCRSVEEFQCLNRIEEGTYGVVYRAKDKKTGGYQCPPLSSGYLGLHWCANYHSAFSSGEQNLFKIFLYQQAGCFQGKTAQLIEYLITERTLGAC